MSKTVKPLRTGLQHAASSPGVRVRAVVRQVKKIYRHDKKEELAPCNNWEWLLRGYPPPPFPTIFPYVSLTVCQCPYLLLGGERHCKDKVSCPRTKHSHPLATWTFDSVLTTRLHLPFHMSQICFGYIHAQSWKRGTASLRGAANRWKHFIASTSAGM